LRHPVYIEALLAQWPLGTGVFIKSNQMKSAYFRYSGLSEREKKTETACRRCSLPKCRANRIAEKC